MSNTQPTVPAAPLNYRSRVREALGAISDTLGTPALRMYVRQMLSLLDRSEVFQLPEDGLSLGEMPMYDFAKLDLYGRLPFPVVAIEFRMSGKKPVFRDAPVVTSRRFAIAVDLMTPELLSLARAMFPGGIALATSILDGLSEHAGRLDAFLLLPIDSIEGDHAVEMRAAGLAPEQCWIPGWAAAVVPYRQGGAGRPYRPAEVSGDAIVVEGEMTELVVKAAHFRTPLGLELHETPGTLDDDARFALDYASELGAATALVAALSCSNIETEKILAPPKLNKARVARGKPGIPDFHMLVVKNRGARGEALDCGQSGRAPVRTHVRRGHVRRLESGPIWINSALVNPQGQGGVARKSYQVG
ncbi:MAG: hypothetical protein E6R08_10285 [Nevskiaceae bacterium]|nr:MAG: hypothetical protein E6R08_10285 [Nevskiaceae bacterium]